MYMAGVQIAGHMCEALACNEHAHFISIHGMFNLLSEVNTRW